MRGEASYGVLGPVEATDADGGPLDLGGAQRRALLAQLVLVPGRVVSVDALIAGLWGDHPPATAVKSVQVHVSKLRTALPAGQLATQAPGYVLAVPAEGTDVGRF